MFRCIYCLKEKDEAEQTLEHVIPQSLGGSCAPDLFKTDQVCRKCNSDLGLFVDASFEKTWFITNWLQRAAMGCFDPENPTGLPLICMGTTNLTPSTMLEDEVCEYYVGPLAETIFLIRSKDERFYWYAGGNPRTLKDKVSSAYYLLTPRSEKNPRLSFLTIKDSFKNKKVRKISCTEIRGLSLLSMGLSEPDESDRKVIEYFWDALEKGEVNASVSINFEFDVRFLAKLARGIGFCLFGERILSGPYANEVNKGIWYRAGDEVSLFGRTFLLSEERNEIAELTGTSCAITFMMSKVYDYVAISISFGKQHGSVIKFADVGSLTDKDIALIQYGLVLILFPYLGQSVLLSLPELIAHKQGRPNAELRKLEQLVEDREGYFAKL